MLNQTKISNISIFTIIVAQVTTIAAVLIYLPDPVKADNDSEFSAMGAGVQCLPKSLKGTYSFDAVGYAPAPPPGLLVDENGVVLDPKVDFSTPDGLTVIPLHAIGHVTFDGHGNHIGYIHENVGGVFEDSVPFFGTYTLSPGPGGVGCQGEWILQDDHRVFPFSEEPQHHFRVALAPESKGFHFIHQYLGADGQATLSGWAPLAYK